MKNLKRLREANNLTQQQMADIFGIQRPTYSRYENGERQPDFGLLIEISKHFNVSVDYLLGTTDEKNQKPGEEKITFDDFPSPMHKEPQDVTDDDKQMLIDMARMLKKRVEEKKAFENMTDK